MLHPATTERDREPDEELAIFDPANLVGQYYRGTVCKLHMSPERGRVRSASGREIPFVFQHVVMRGDRRRFDDLREGLTVGYDVSWTARGLRVSTIWIPGDDAGGARA